MARFASVQINVLNDPTMLWLIKVIISTDAAED
jgi:hypothetical protein